MVFSLLVNRDDLELQPQTSAAIPGDGGFLRGRVISDNEDRVVGISNVDSLGAIGAVSNHGVLVLNEDRAVISSSVYNFVNLLSVIEVNLLTVYDSTSMTVSIPAHSHKPVAALPTALSSFAFTVTTQQGDSTNNTNYSGGFSIEKSSPFSDNSFVIEYSGSRNTFVRDYISAITNTNVIIGDLPNDFTNAQGVSNDPARLLSDSYTFNFVEGMESVHTVSATGDAPLTYSLSGSLPSGLSISPTSGTISGTTNVVGTTNHTMTVSNALGSDTASVSIVVQAFTSAPVFTVNSYNLLFGVNQPSAFTPNVVGSEPITYSISGTLPTGLSLNTSTGEISGTPTVVQDTSHVLTATNAYGSDTANVNFVIAQEIMLDYPAVPAGTTAQAGGTFLNITSGNYLFTSAVSVTEDVQASTSAGIHITVESGDLDVGETFGNLSNGKVEVGVMDGDFNITRDVTLASNGSMLAVVSGEMDCSRGLTNSSNGSIEIQVGSLLDVARSITCSSNGTITIFSNNDIEVTRDVSANGSSGTITIGASDDITINRDIITGSSGTIEITAGGSVTGIDACKMQSSNGTITIEAGGNVTMSEVPEFSGSGNMLTVTSTSGTITIAGTNHGSSYTQSN